MNKFYKTQIIVSLLFLSACSGEVQSSVDVDCTNLKACELKICNLKNDIQIAKKADNKNRVNG